MTTKGTIVPGSVTDLALAYLRDHPGGWTLYQITAALGYAKRQVSASLDALCGSHRASRRGRPARYNYLAPAVPARSCVEIAQDAELACPLYVLRARPRDEGEAAGMLPTGMYASARNKMMVLSFAGQKSGRDRGKPRAVPADERARIAKLGAKASIWKRRAAV